MACNIFCSGALERNPGNFLGKYISHLITSLATVFFLVNDSGFTQHLVSTSGYGHAVLK